MKKIIKSILCMIIAVCMVLAGDWLTQAGASDIPELTADQIYKTHSASVFYMRVLKEDGTLKTVGSGFLIGAGKALTAYHVIDGGTDFEAVFDDGSIVRGLKVLKSSKDSDQSLIAIDSGNRPVLQLSGVEAQHGQKVFALGYPLKATKIITEGIINAPEADINNQRRMLVSAQVASGMSGGPLLDSHGTVAGLISGSLRNMSNIHICISAKNIRSFIEGGK